MLDRKNKKKQNKKHTKKYKVHNTVPRFLPSV